MSVLLLIQNGCAKSDRIYRVGILVGAETMSEISDGFKAELTRRGYIEGSNISYDIQKIDNDPSRDGIISRKFIKDGVDLIFVFPGQTALTVKKIAKGSGIPVVFANSLIEGTGLIDSVQNPGDNITGVRNPENTMAIKSLDYLMEFDPKPSRIMVVYVPSYPTNSAILKELRLYILSVNATLIELPVASVASIESALNNIERTTDADAIMLMPDFIPRTKDAVKVIIDYADLHHIPVIGGPLPLLKEGTLLTINSDNRKQGELAASLAVRIFEGVPAGTIPVITPEEQLFINYRKSRELGLKASRGLLRQAKEIIR